MTEQTPINNPQPNPSQLTYPLDPVTQQILTDLIIKVLKAKSLI